MSCKRFAKDWPRWSAGDLPRARRTAFEEHLTQCPACAGRAETLRAASSEAAAALADPGAPTTAEWRAMLAALPQAARPRPRAWAYGLTLAAAAALAVILWLPRSALPPGESLDGGTAGRAAQGRKLALVDAAAEAERYEMRLATNDPKIKIVWVFDRNLDL